MILVTGGSGMIGKELKTLLPNAIYVSSGNYDLRSQAEVNKMFQDIRPERVVHLAATVSGIQDNIKRPADHYYNNIMINTNVIEYARIWGVKNLIAISSTCAYPDVASSYPLVENQLHESAPTGTNFSYGYAKRCMSVQIDSYNKQYGLNYNYLIPCNIYGEHDKFDERSHYVAALIEKIHFAKENKTEWIELMGTGKPLRQFIYAKDVAYIICYCLNQGIYENMNIAPNEIYSIDKIARIALKACGADHLKIAYNDNLPDGQYRKDVSNLKLMSHIKNLQFTKLFDGIKSTYEKYSNR